MLLTSEVAPLTVTGGREGANSMYSKLSSDLAAESEVRDVVGVEVNEGWVTNSRAKDKRVAVLGQG